jgi:hypothetical protein
MSVRRAVARPGRTGDLIDEVRDYERSVLGEPQKAALRLTDAFLTTPARFAPDARAELMRHFDPEQVVELVFKLTYWTSNKPLIALGIDGAADSEGLTSFHYDENGAFVLDPA